MQIHLKNFALWRILIATFLSLFLFVAYFFRNPTSMTFSKIRLKESCLSKGVSRSISQIVEQKSQMIANRQSCQIISPIIDQIFEMEVSSRTLSYSNTGFKDSVASWLGTDNDTLTEEFKHQKIITIYHKWTRQTSSFNSMRGIRPKSHPRSDSSRILTESIKSCDFCTKRLANDALGIDALDERVIVADSAFKLQDYNALFIFKKHNPLDLVKADYVSLFITAQRWFDAVISDSSDGHSHPMLVWDFMPASGASQLHAHAHGFLGRGHALGHFRNYQEARESYVSFFQGSDLTQDYINIHISLGLGFRFGPNVILSPLDAVKNHEFVLIGPKVDETFADIVHIVHLTYVRELKITSWSSGMSWPVSDGDLAIMRVGSRSVNDVTSMELYMFNSISSDPYATIEALQRTLRGASR